jgi:hypothetical protein
MPCSTRNARARSTSSAGRPGQRRPCRPSGRPGTGIPSQPGTLRAQSPRAAVYAHPDLDQPTPQNRHQPSLNRDVGCLKVIDTFRGGSSVRCWIPSLSNHLQRLQPDRASDSFEFHLQIPVLDVLLKINRDLLEPLARVPGFAEAKQEDCRGYSRCYAHSVSPPLRVSDHVRSRLLRLYPRQSANTAREARTG